MADGTSKAIEKIVKGDRVKAAKHDDPTGAVGDYEVMEVYERIASETLELDFGSLKIQCTKEHPLFVYGKGWVQAENLKTGDLCRNAEGNALKLQAKTLVPDEVKVYIDFQKKIVNRSSFSFVERV